MSKSIKTSIKQVLDALSGKIGSYYLAGGTALSLYYFRHRESVDLDFFSPEFNKKEILKIIGFLSDKLEMKIVLIAEETLGKRAKMAVFRIEIARDKSLKLDFVEDYLKLLKAPKLINGIKVLSLEDIYLRKIYAITGTLMGQDIIGRRMALGGRQEAKDFFDLYCLSHTFMKISDFSFKYCNQSLREALIRWFRTYNRLDFKSGLLELKLNKKAEYRDIERHFKKEIDKILDKEVNLI